jgi:hypothetical protein
MRRPYAALRAAATIARTRDLQTRARAARLLDCSPPTIPLEHDLRRGATLDPIFLRIS